jgi:hypothetical protein
MFNSDSDCVVVQTKLLATCWLGQKGQAGKRGRAARAPSHIFCLFRNLHSDISYDCILNIKMFLKEAKRQNTARLFCGEPSSDHIWPTAAGYSVRWFSQHVTWFLQHMLLE